MRIVHCAECGRNKPHGAHGLCCRCHHREWRKAHRAEVAAYKRQYYKAHRAREAASRLEYYYAHRAECLARRRKWQKANPDKGREAKQRRRARKKGAMIGPVDERAIYRRDNYRCVYDGVTEDLTLDHIVPLASGGAHCEDNLVVACRKCNSSKGTTPLIVWMLRQSVGDCWQEVRPA